MDLKAFKELALSRNIRGDIERYYADPSINQSYLKALLKARRAVDPSKYVTRRSVSHFEKGSALDFLTTFPGSDLTEEFEVLTMKRPGNKPDEILKIIEERGLEWTEENAMQIAAEIEYLGKNAKEETRKKNLDSLFKYMSHVSSLSKTKSVLTFEEMVQVNTAYQKLIENPATSKFVVDSGDSDIVHLPQFPVYVDYKYDGVIIPCKALLDRLIAVQHSGNKTLYIVDYKTVNGSMLGFPKSVFKFRYDLQASFYMTLVQEMYLDWSVVFVFVVVSLTHDEPPMVFSVDYDTICSGRNGSDDDFNPNLKGGYETALDWHLHYQKVTEEEKLYPPHYQLFLTEDHKEEKDFQYIGMNLVDFVNPK